VDLTDAFFNQTSVIIAKECCEKVTLRQGARVVIRNGRRLYVEMTFALVTEQAGGAVRGAVAVARDVSERIEQQRAMS
jgi:PAS domain S-box-containing protein